MPAARQYARQTTASARSRSFEARPSISSEDLEGPMSAVSLYAAAGAVEAGSDQAILRRVGQTRTIERGERPQSRLTTPFGVRPPRAVGPFRTMVGELQARVVVKGRQILPARLPSARFEVGSEDPEGTPPIQTENGRKAIGQIRHLVGPARGPDEFLYLRPPWRKTMEPSSACALIQNG